ncbi:MAG TPA: protein kinase [Candidatus Methylomirabilis sp.]|nr:protein kinase [Candidatus Methylomirabilis sp.]
MQHLGKYEIISEIGRGAMGAVYKARDPLIDRLVALKTITGGSSAQSLLDRFYQEARSAGTLQHPNIVTIYELGHEKNTPFIAMEFLEGESLDHIIEQHPALPLSVKLGYIVRVCEALAYAHQHNVVHRDVKPGNIMVTKEGVVKVVDFGIARLTDMSMTQPNMMIGSRAYMSPQLYKGERADARSDIWAIGVTLYELLAYKRPFTGDSEAELMFHIIYENPEGLQAASPDCSEELALIVSRMLEKKAEDRYQSMDDVLHALEPIWKVAQQTTVSGLLADCKDLVEAKDFQRAQALLRKALHIDVGNTQAKTMLEKVTMELRRTEILPRLKEHMSRGEGFLKTGRLREAKAEAEAALGLDSKHEPAQKLIAEVEAAEAKAQQLEQKLRLTKQRLAEGALTEAAAALGQALELDSVNAQAQELRKQIDEERNRREKRKKLGEILHRARTLWTELNYDECLSLLATALEEFPNDPELKKLQETAKTDQAEQVKQRQMAEVRRLLGQQNFDHARKALETLTKDFPTDTAVKNLQNLAVQEENEQKRQKRLDTEIAALRGLLGAGKFKQVVVKGEPLLQEYPQDYELKELVNFARGEVTQLEQKRKEEEREKQIQGFLMCERYGEALEAARRGMEEFPKQDVFRKLAAEAEAQKKEQDDRERARAEMQRRVREINSKINQDKITDAIDLAQKTMATMGPDPNVTQLLQGAEQKKKKKEEESKVSALRTMINRGDQAGATQLFKEVMATQILQPNDPRVKELRGQISALTSRQPAGGTQPRTEAQKPPAAQKEKPAPKKPAPPAGDATQLISGARGSAPGTVFSATRVMGPSESSGARTGATVPPPRPDSPAKEPPPRPAQPPDATMLMGGPARPSATATGVPAEPRQRPAAAGGANVATQAAAPGKPAHPDLIAQIVPILRKPPVLVGAGTVVLLILAVAFWPRHGSAGSKKELALKQQAEELWQNRQFDRSEQVWKQVAEMKGGLQVEANRRVAEIEQKRADEQTQFDAGMGLLADKKDCTGAQQAFQSVVDANLWHAEEGVKELADAKACSTVVDQAKQEKDDFDEGERLFKAGKLDDAEKQFRATVELNVPNSTLRPDAEKYIGRIRQTQGDEKTYQAALQDFQDEKFASAHDGFQALTKKKGPRTADAKKQLSAVETAQGQVSNLEGAIRGHAYRTAKGQLDSVTQFKQTHERLASELQTAEQQEFATIRANASAVEKADELAQISHAIDELHGYEGRAEDRKILDSCKAVEDQLNAAYNRALQKSGDNAALETAIGDFTRAVSRKDIDGLKGPVLQEFQKIANGNGPHKLAAAQYVTATIPKEIDRLRKTAGKVEIPALTCGPGKAVGPPVPSASGAVTCAQLDAPLQWAEIATVDFPDEAKQPGKLPYTLTVFVTAEQNGSVKIDKDTPNADKDFLKKVKDASKHWKTSVPKSQGKPVSVRFPLMITFQH